MQIQNIFRAVTIALLCLLNKTLIAQTTSTKIITGTITEASTQEPLPFVAVSLKHNLLSTISNESGNFDFLIPEGISNDTLIISSIGFNTLQFPLASITSPLKVSLQSGSTELKEVMILPMPPEYYIKMAVNSLSLNYPSHPFQTESYYREKMIENDNIMKFTEAVFNSYYPDYQDTSKVNAHQLLLYNKLDDKKLAFMNGENRKKKKKKNPSAQTDTSQSGATVNLSEIMGGPEEILKLDIIRGKEDFLDSTYFKHFDYEFAASSTYDNQELMVINFRSKRRLDHVKKDGKIYIDLESNAIVKMEYTGDLTLPALIQPILFVLGIHVERPDIHKTLEYQKINGQWYPRNIQADIAVNLTKRHMFSKNEHSRILIDGIFTVNKLITENTMPVNKEKTYSSKKKMEEQVFNDNNVTWDKINVIKR